MDSNKEKYLEDLNGYLDFIAELDAKELASRRELGEINFTDGLPVLEEAIEFAEEVRYLPLELLPIILIEKLRGHFGEIDKHFKQVKAFTLTGQTDPTTARDTILVALKKRYDLALLDSLQFTPWLSLKKTEVKDTVLKSQKLLAETEKTLGEFSEKVQQKFEQLESIVEAAKSAAASVGVAQFATKFDEQAKEHKVSSINWLITSGIMAIVTIIVAIVLLFNFPLSGNISDSSVFQPILAKLVILSVLYFSTLWAAKNYKAHRHLDVVNRHRQAALTTFETFVNAAEGDSQTKNAVLLEATHCIFSPSSTGYLNQKQETSGNKIVEVVKHYSNAVHDKE